MNDFIEILQKNSQMKKRFTSIKFYVDKDVYKEVPNAVQSLTRKKMKAYFEEKLKGNTADHKKLWETLKQLVLSNQRSPSSNIFLKKKEALTTYPVSMSGTFQKSYSNHANNLVRKLQTVVNKFQLWKLTKKMYLKFYPKTSEKRCGE